MLQGNSNNKNVDTSFNSMLLQKAITTLNLQQTFFCHGFKVN